jgi:hypothetical protein
MNSCGEVIRINELKGAYAEKASQELMVLKKPWRSK